jgi:hypothetical protein
MPAFSPAPATPLALTNSPGLEGLDPLCYTLPASGQLLGGGWQALPVVVLGQL